MPRPAFVERPATLDTSQCR